jgi:hypothetical protein
VTYVNTSLIPEVISVRNVICTIGPILRVALGGLVVACLPLGPRFAGSNPAEDDGF